MAQRVYLLLTPGNDGDVVEGAISMSDEAHFRVLFESWIMARQLSNGGSPSGDDYSEEAIRWRRLDRAIQEESDCLREQARAVADFFCKADEPAEWELTGTDLIVKSFDLIEVAPTPGRAVGL